MSSINRHFGICLLLFLAMLLPSAYALTATYYVDTVNCTPWTNGGCSTTDSRGYSGSSTLNCAYTDSLPQGSTVSNVQVEGYVKFLCSPSTLTFKWGEATIGYYSTVSCTCNTVGTAFNYSLNSPAYTVGGTNTISRFTAGTRT